MTQEDKETLKDLCNDLYDFIQQKNGLLLKDLSARLPYGVFVKWKTARNPAIIKSISDEKLVIYREYSIGIFDWECCIEDIKPYLRPMSSMTEEENKEFNAITNGENGFYEDEDGWVRCDNIHTKWGVWPNGCAEMLDWLNSHHFDYRGLIEKGLALEAPEDMYNF